MKTAEFSFFARFTARDRRLERAVKIHGFSDMSSQNRILHTA